MAVSIVIDITQNSQNVANNTSNITVKVNAKWTGGSYNLLEKSGSCTIDGTKYTFTSPFNTGKTTSGSCNLYTKTLNITHASNGTKTLSVFASYTSGVSSGTVAASASKTLTTIPRKSTLSVANGTLGTSQTLTVTRQSTSFTHSIKAVCGNSTFYIKADGTTQSSEVKHTDCSIPFTPPLSWASQNTTGTSVSIKYTITTYNGNTSVGSNSYTKTCSIPASVKPSCTVAVSDPTGYNTTFGGYIKGISKFEVVVTPTLSYGSSIDSYSTTANGATYTAASFTTGVLKSSGTLTVSATVEDERGRSGTASTSLTVLNYTQPVVDKLTVKRCNSDGTENDKGEYVFVTFSATVTSLNTKNTAEYILRYKKSTEAEIAFSEVPMTNYNNVYSVSDATFIFPADSGNSYDVELLVCDAFYSGDKAIKSATSASTAFTLLHWGADGRSLAIGKIAEEPELFDIGLPTRFNEPVYGKALGMDKLPGIPENSNFNDYMEPGCYAVHSNAIAATCANIPIDRAGRLEVWSATGEGVRLEQWSYLRQRFIPYNSTNAVWERDITRNETNVWTYYDWWQSTLTPTAAEKIYSKAAMTISLSDNHTFSVASAYTKIPLNTVATSTSERLTLESGSIRIGKNISYIKVSGQVLINGCTVNGNRHIRIQKLSGSTVSSIAWNCAYSVTSGNTVYAITPIIAPVKEGDLFYFVYYTSDTSTYATAGSAANGWQTYLTVEEL